MPICIVTIHVEAVVGRESKIFILFYSLADLAKPCECVYRVSVLRNVLIGLSGLFGNALYIGFYFYDVCTVGSVF